MSRAEADETPYPDAESHLLATIIKDSFDVVAVVTPEGIIRELSPSFETNFKYRRDEIRGRSFLELVYPDDRRDSRRAFEALVARKGAVKRLEARFVDRDGSWRFAEMRGSNLIGQPPIDGILVHWHDVTAFKWLEGDLGDSERRYKALFDNSGDAIFVHDLNGRFLDVNEVACERLGYSREELLELTPADIDQPDFAELVPQRIKEITERGHLFIETAHIANDGRVIPIELSARLIEYAGEPAIISTARDISERKQMERLIETQLELGIALGATSDMKEALSCCLDAAIKLSGMDAGCIFLLDDEMGSGRTVCSRGVPEDAARMLDHGADSSDMWLAREGKPFYGNSRDLERIIGRPHPDEGIRSFAIVPVLHEGLVRACMRMGSRTMEEVPASGRRFLEVVAAQMGSVIARLKVETALQESEARFRSLVEQAGTGILMTDPEGKLTFVNETLCRMLGYEEEDMISKLYAWFIHPDDINTIADSITHTLTDPERQLHLEFRALHKDGRVIDCHTQPRAKLLNGRVIGYSAILRDVTELKRIEGQDLALHDLGLALGGCSDLETALHMCLETAIGMTEMDSGSIYMADSDSGWLYVAVSRGYGEEFTNILNYREPDPAYAPIVSEGRPVYYSVFYPGILTNKSIIREGITAAAIIPVCYEGRSIACMNISSHVLEEVPAESRLFLEILAVQIASTLSRLSAEEALLRSEERFKNIIEHTNDIFFMHDLDNRMTYLSPQAQTILGSSSEQMGMEWTEWLTDNALNEEGKRATQEALKTGRKQNPYLLEFRRQDGGKVWLEIDESPIRDADGDIAGMVGVARNVSERKQAELRLEAYQEQLRALTGRLQSAREEERAIIARELHDVVGQALTGLRFDLEWLGTRLPERKSPGHDRLSEKIDDMLLVLEETIKITRRLSTELRPPELEYFGLVSAIESQVREWRERTATECVFIRDMEDEIDLTAEASIALYRVVQESLTNVARHASASRARIRLKVEGESVLLEITDNGRGIRLSEIDDIKSLGILGMKERVNLLGGDFSITGREGKGTKILVSLPII
ncbi:MAG: PAS domain S-box protein [Actinobacteria bacterium]|nr:PAS domain S-box protein [Actinomycetota bacterium]